MTSQEAPLPPFLRKNRVFVALSGAIFFLGLIFEFLFEPFPVLPAFLSSSRPLPTFGGGSALKRGARDAPLQKTRSAEALPATAAPGLAEAAEKPRALLVHR